MKGWRRLAIALTVLWVLICIGNAIYDCQRIPQGIPLRGYDSSPFMRVYKSTVLEQSGTQFDPASIGAVPVDNSAQSPNQLAPGSTGPDRNGFRKQQRQITFDDLVPSKAATAETTVQTYYTSAFEWQRLAMIALIPAAVGFLALMLLGWTLRWIAHGFGEWTSVAPFFRQYGGAIIIAAALVICSLIWALTHRYEFRTVKSGYGTRVEMLDRWTGQ